ncbi:interferon lambda receptor 1 isoform X2 [Erinaceus europaeus]|nr:interferon lambda receptor 1 isoform X2 [Erinaceus europaeus]
MCLEKLDLFNKFKARVLATSPNSRSHWVVSKSLDYLFDVEPAPPVLTFTRTEEFLSINAMYQLPHCAPLQNLNYRVAFWKEGTVNQTLFPVTAQDQTVQIPLPQAPNGRYCLSARTIYIFTAVKYSKFSPPTCFSLEAPGTNWAYLVLFLLPVLLVITIGYVMWKSLSGNPWYQPAELPQALDFSGYRYSMATLQISGAESMDNLVLCPPQKLIRRFMLTPQVRTLVTVHTGTEKDSSEEEEEDTDDRFSFCLYTEPPPFLGKEHQVLGHSEAGDPRIPLVWVKEAPAWYSSGQSWPSSADSSSWDEAGSSGYLAKKGRGHRQGVDQIQEPLPLLEVSEDSGSVVKFSKDDFLVHWSSLSPRQNLVPGEPQISLQTLTICLDSDPEEDNQEKEEWRERESETEDSGAGSWEAESFLETKDRSQTLGHYMAR